MWLGKTSVWTYDDAGNITSCKEYAYINNWEDVTGTPTKTNTYTYGDSSWGDLLTAYNGVTWQYDQIGNLTNDGTWTYTWQNGRELASMSNGSTSWNYTYDANGMRTSRSNGSTTYTYVYNGDQLVQMTKGSDTLYFTYGAIGPTTVTWNGTTYYYAVNAQGDVMGIFDGSGNCVVTYNWDNAWGYNPEPEGSLADTLGALNPLRYRSYVYDQETDLYYVSTRYYNAEVCRWINADDVGILFEDSVSIISGNLFAYCWNNPVNKIDETGESPANIIGGIVGGVTGAALGYLLAQKLGLTGFKKAALIAAATIGGAALGAFLGPYVAKLAKSIGSTVKSAVKTLAKGELCFVAGTKVLCESGFESIEDIQVGDYVYAENPDTGEVLLKRVLQVFVNETIELVHVVINGEEIVTTPGHPFYVEHKGWVGADSLCPGDIVYTVDGDRIGVDSVRVVRLNKPVTVYNLEVEDFHTYFVGEQSILVHNKGCGLNKLSNSYLKKTLKLDAHKIKYEYLGRRAKVSLYDLAVDKKTGIIYIIDKAGKIITSTSYTTK